MSDEIVILGTVENVIYKNKENGYTVFVVKGNENEEENVCVGQVPNVNCGEQVKLTGRFIVHPTYGKQLSVAHFENDLPTKSDNIQKYLASGVIKGVSKGLAKRIVQAFGEKSLAIIEDYPEKLAQIKGISENMSYKIQANFHQQREMREVMLFLQPLGISLAMAQSIYKVYKDDTINIVKTNPYILTDQIFGVGFKTADSIAEKMGIEKNSQHRLMYGIKYVLQTATNNGHVYLPQNEMLEQSKELLGIEIETLERTCIELQFNRVICREKINDTINNYLNQYFYAEKYTSKKLLELARNNEPQNNLLEEEIIQMEIMTNIELDDKQRMAVKYAMECGVLIITGGPGTGKTTTINTIIRMLEMHNADIELAAPTGRAAKRLEEATGHSAKTIHRLLQNVDGINSFNKDENDPIDADVIIIDESSMVDINLMSALLKAIAETSRLILVGDINQLPSVGAGNVLRDIISSGQIKVIELDKIFRQAQESAIVMNAHRIIKGEYPILNEKERDFFFIRQSNPEIIQQTIAELIIKRLPSYTGCNPFMDIQVLTPMRKSILGTKNLNQMLQSVLNPENSNKNQKEHGETLFRVGDKVMQIKNNYNMSWKIFKASQTEDGQGVYNGDTGIIRSIDTDNESLDVLFDDNRLVTYDFTQLDELEHSYAITIHKSQGSEYPIVVMPLIFAPPMLMSRNILYTAITRAKTMVVIVGLQEAIHTMVDNSKEVQRYSSLCRRLQLNSNLKNYD